MRNLLTRMCGVVVVAGCSVNLWAQGGLFEQLQSPGIQLDSEVYVKLSPPLLLKRQPGEVKSLLEGLAKRHGWERFSRNSPSSPVYVETNYVNDPNDQRVGHNVYSAFIAYAPLAKLQDQELMATLFGSGSDDKERMGFDPQELPEQILQKAGITTTNQDSVRFSTLRIPLMNRIAIEGTARIEKTEHEGALIISWEIDQHFTLGSSDSASELAKYANRYRKIARNELGNVVESEPVPYRGCGGYLSVVQTGLAENQLLIESRMAIHEPQEWFAGSNYLRSKFPAALQESAQSFRRKMAKK